MPVLKNQIGLGGFAMGLAAIALLLSSCDENPRLTVYEGRHQPQTAEEIAFAKSVLNDLQARSISENLEYCGFIGLDRAGKLWASPALQGGEGDCQPEAHDEDMRVLASYHTHAGFAEDYDSEVPSEDDLSADILEGIDGYIATPGGRIWYNSAEQKRAILICGENCVLADSTYQADLDFPVADSYDLNGLRSR